MLINQELIQELLCYNQNTGEFRRRSGSRAGKIAGSRRNDYTIVCVAGQYVLAHRLAWLYVHGWMPRQLDHKNGNPSDNRIDNLRPSTQAENKQNARAKKSAKSGLKGICYCRLHKKWRAAIGPRGAVKHLGYFETPELANAAYAEAAQKMYGEFARAT